MTKDATTRLSSKRQITIPARMARALGLEPGDHLIIRLEGERIALLPVPESYTKNFAGSLAGRYGDADQYVREERAAWTQE